MALRHSSFTGGGRSLIIHYNIVYAYYIIDALTYFYTPIIIPVSNNKGINFAAEDNNFEEVPALQEVNEINAGLCNCIIVTLLQSFTC